MAKWILEVEDHPCVKDGEKKFKDLRALEYYIGQNAIQIDHIVGIEKAIQSGRNIKYTVSEIIPMSSIRLVLKEA
jgi:hypothetical protein